MKMKKKDQTEPENKRRRKSTRTDSHDRDKEANVAPAKTARQDDKGISHSSTKKSPKSAAVKAETFKPRDLSEISVMQIEEKEAEQRASTDDVETYKKTCKEIQRLVSEVNDFKAEGKQHNDNEIIERRIQASLLTTSLKKLNRLSLIRGKKAKEKTQELKQKVDALHLDLQNLLYEVMHMKKEIHRCTDFTSKEEDIDLIAVDDFYEEAPDDISNPSLTREDSHQQMLARLEWELQQRKKLATMKDQLVTTKGDIEKEILEKRETLDSLKPSLQGILKSTLPVQEKMGLNIDAKKAQCETAMYLSKPLYVLYVQATAYRDAADHDLAIKIDGDVQAAKALLERDNLDLGEYEDSDDGEDTNDAGDKEANKRKKHRKDKEKARLEDQRRSVLRKHPLTVTVKIHCKGSVSLSIQFSYLSTLQIVTTAASLEFPNENSSPVLTTSPLLSSESILKDLFAGDHGNTTPNPSNQYQLKKLGLEEFTTYVSIVGRPYYWVQTICGLHYLPNTPPQTLVPDATLSSQSIEAVVKTIKSRICTRLSLQNQLTCLETLTLPLNTTPVDWFPANILSRLVNWKCLTYSDFTALDFTKEFIAAEMVGENDRFYLATLKRDKEVMQAAIAVGVNYPSQPPLFALSMKSDKMDASSTNAREIECELNTNFTEFAKTEPAMLLTNLLKRLLVCFDVYCETGDTGVKEERLFIKTRRGRDRIRPYKYEHQKGFFIHR